MVIGRNCQKANKKQRPLTRNTTCGKINNHVLLTTKIREKIVEYLLMFLVSLAVGIPLSIYGGFVLFLLWAWFITPVFGLTELSIIQAIGVILVARMVCPSPSSDDDDKTLYFRFVKATAQGIAKPTVALLMGVIFQFFM